MDLTFDIRDYYDWAGPGEYPQLFPLYIDIETVGNNPQVVVLEYVNETELYDLHCAGYGRNFLTKGSFTIQLTWNEGDTYNG